MSFVQSVFVYQLFVDQYVSQMSEFHWQLQGDIYLVSSVV